MNMRKMSEEDRLNVCRKYAYGSLLALPWLGLVNLVWFWRVANEPSANRLFKKCKL